MCKGNFSELGDQLSKIIISFVENKNLAKLIYYKTDNPLSEPDVENPYSLLNTQIFPLLYKNPTSEETVYVSVFFGKINKSVGNPYFKRGRLYINIAVHRSLWQADGTIRVYSIMHEIDNILNRQDVTGSLSKDWFESATYLPVNELYQSMSLEYQFFDS